jgi:serine/threonine protein kinase
MPLAIGQTVAGYTIVRLIGAGGMGEVYLAQHPRLPRQDAFKVLHAEAAPNSDFRERFIREADLAAKLTHSNIVSVYDRGEVDGQLWISSQYIEGTDTAQLLADHYAGGMPPEMVADIVTGIAAALDFANSQGLLHRDVKPANILLSAPDGDGCRHTYLADFGIARTLAEPNGLTVTGMTVGTFAYSAPEQLLGEDVDGRADQYGLAATAYHLLTGTRLFPNSNVAVVINDQINTPPPRLADRRPDLAPLDEVFKFALSKRPEDRFRRSADFAAALAEQIRSPGATRPSDPTAAAAAPTLRDAARSPIPSPVPAQGGATRKRALAVAAIGAAVVLVAATLLFWRPWQHEPSSERPSSPPAARAVDSVDAGDAPAKASLVGSGFAQAGNYVQGIAVVKADDPAAVGRFVTASANFKDASGRTVATEEHVEAFSWLDQELVLPIWLDVSDRPAGTKIAAIDVSVSIGNSNLGAKSERPPMPVLTAEEIRPGRFGSYTAAFSFTNKTGQDLKNLRIGVVCYDATGAIIGGGSDYPDLAPAGKSIRIEPSMLKVSGEPASCKAFPNYGF